MRQSLGHQMPVQFENRQDGQETHPHDLRFRRGHENVAKSDNSSAGFQKTIDPGALTLEECRIQLEMVHALRRNQNFLQSHRKPNRSC